MGGPGISAGWRSGTPRALPRSSQAPTSPPPEPPRGNAPRFQSQSHSGCFDGFGIPARLMQDVSARAVDQVPFGLKVHSPIDVTKRCVGAAVGMIRGGMDEHEGVVGRQLQSAVKQTARLPVSVSCVREVPAVVCRKSRARVRRVGKRPPATPQHHGARRVQPSRGARARAWPWRAYRWPVEYAASAE